jgi:hypothetical protein
MDERQDPRVVSLSNLTRHFKLNMIPPHVDLFLLRPADASIHLKAGDHIMTPLLLQDSRHIMDKVAANQIVSGEVIPDIIRNTGYHHGVCTGPNEIIEFGGRGLLRNRSVANFLGRNDFLFRLDYKTPVLSWKDSSSLADKLTCQPADYDAKLFNCEHIATFIKTGMWVQSWKQTSYLTYICKLQTEKPAK